MKLVYIEISMITMFLTGILQWDILDLEWQKFSIIQFLHIVGSLFLTILLILPFIKIHISKYKKNITKSKNIDGVFLTISLFLILLSGFYLFLVGNRGGDMLGKISYYIHLYGSFVLILFLLKHTKMMRTLAFFIVFLPSVSHASQNSSSLYMTKDAKYIYSANLDGGSIAKIDAYNGKKIFEKVIGKDIRKIAFNDDESICGVTDYMSNRVLFLDKNANLLQEIKTGNKPYAIVYDKTNRHFIVTLYEDAQILIIDGKKLNIIKKISTKETPRGIALTQDGRVLVTHSMIGVVSIYDSKSFEKLKILTLHSSQDNDEFVSQGAPRLLDDIEISPDGSEAWLPHVLWNFDHPFQFQSTVFPSISVISLERENERELEDERKHLFKSINVLNNKNDTMIVSNPYDLVFSNDGARAFVTMAGSEDIVVFSLQRSLDKNEKRHRKKTGVSGGGAKATQILRAYPDGTNPQSIIVHPKNNNIYVQNGSRLDLTLLDSGGSHSFAEISIKQESFCKLVEKDPLSSSLREGKTLFNNANSDFNKDTPMSGDFWMSCNSCHFEGFNFTNRYLFLDTKADKFKSSITGHKNLSSFLSKTPLIDYIKIARDTQGGMGADPKAVIVGVNPDKMGEALEAKMRNLHHYVTSNENLRYLSNWIKLEEDIDKYHVEDWTNSAKCKSCHLEIFNQWADSNHRNIAGTNPYYMVLENLAAKTEGEDFRKWCMGCHNPSSVTTGVAKSTDNMNNFLDKGAKSMIEELKTHGNSKLEEGVSCVACHRITKVENAGGNASYTLGVSGRQKYVFEDNKADMAQWLSSRFINSKPNAHKDSYMKEVYKDPKYCASCHDEFTPGVGSEVVSTFREWEMSSYNDPNNPKNHKTCIDCHMTNLKDGAFFKQRGVSTDGGAVKNDVKVHYFAGSNHFLAGLRNKENENQIIQLLKTAAKLDIEMNDKEILVGVKNVGAGHHLPTGVADFRELWLEVDIFDRDGKVIFKSGKLQNDGNLPKDARVFMKVFGDKDSKEAGLHFWRYEKMLKDTRIAAGERRVESYSIGAVDGLKYPLKAVAKLNFRIYPQWVTDIVKQTYPALPNPYVVELNRVEKEFKR